MFDQAPAAMLAVGDDARLLRLNGRAEAMLGWSRRELQGSQVGLLAPPGQREEFVQALLSPAERSGCKAAGLAVGWRADGQRMMLELESSRIDVDDASLVMTVLTDVTDQLAEECRLRAAAQAMNRCMNRVHHRMKNNLQTLCSLLDLQKGTVSDPPSIDILTDSFSRMVSMALVHQAICGSPAEECMNFRLFLELLVKRLRDTHSKASSQVAVDLNVVDLRLGMDRAITCGLVITELLTKAFRQALRSGEGFTVALSLPNRTTASLRLSWRGAGKPERCSDERAFSDQIISLLVAQSGGQLCDRHPGAECLEFLFPT